MSAPGSVRVTVDGFVDFVRERLEREDLRLGVRPVTARRIARAILAAHRGAERHGLLEEITPVCQEAFDRLVPLGMR